MKEFCLVRISFQPECTLGVLQLDFKPICLTLEPPWINNETNESCIPPGTYTAEQHQYKSKLTAGCGWTYALRDVPDRSGILFHVGNYPKDTRGCILPGMSYGTAEDGSHMVRNSKEAFLTFLRAAGEESEIGLKIIEVREGETC